jgi:hypothetical protein
MRQVSEELLSQTAATPAGNDQENAEAARPGAKRKPDVNALGRWTKPGGRSNWHIPVGRVIDVAHQLGATSDERDALMLARLTEIAKDDPKHDVLVCGAWVAERVSEQHQLDSDEQAVLDAFRKTRAVTPYSMITPTGLAKLQGLFEELAQEHLAELAQEQDGDGGASELSADDETRLRERRTAAMTALRETKAPPKRPTQVSAQVLARRFLRSLRNARPSA